METYEELLAAREHWKGEAEAAEKTLVELRMEIERLDADLKTSREETRAATESSQLAQKRYESELLCANIMEEAQSRTDSIKTIASLLR